MFHPNLQGFSHLFKDYTELRLQENRTTLIQSLNGNLVSNSKTSEGGVSARSFKNGFWGFSSNPEINDKTIKAVIDSSGINASFLASKVRSSNHVLPKAFGTHSSNFATKKKRLSQKELLEFVSSLDNHLVKTYPQLTGRTIVLQILDMEKQSINSLSSFCYSYNPRTVLFIKLNTDDVKGEPIDVGEFFGGLGHFEDIFESPSELFPKIDKLHEHLMNKREAVFAKAGIKNCILDSSLAGILAHEAIGHTTEADLVLGGSVAGDFVDKQVANELVTLTDYAHSAHGATCPIPVYIDDEGTPAVDIRIIDKGILKGFMHNRETADHFKTNPTGNARGYKFSDEPLIRMRNTAFEPGQSKLSEMIESIDDGYYLLDPSNGQADSTSEFMFGVALGYEIKNGKISNAIKNTTISGIAFDVLKTVTMISDDMTWGSGGMCGKKQMIPTGMGGPAIKCMVNLGGK